MLDKNDLNLEQWFKYLKRFQMIRTRASRLGPGFVSNSFARFFSTSVLLIGLNGLHGCGTLVDRTQRPVDLPDGGQTDQCVPLILNCQSTIFPLDLIGRDISHITQYPRMRGTFTQTEVVSLVSDEFVREYTSTFKDNSDRQRGLVLTDNHDVNVRLLGQPFRIAKADETGLLLYKTSVSGVLSTDSSDSILVNNILIKLLRTTSSSKAVIGFFSMEGEELSRIEQGVSGNSAKITLVSESCESTILLRVLGVADGIVDISVISQEVFLPRNGYIKTNGIEWPNSWTSYLEFNDLGDLTQIRITGHRNWDVCL